MYSPDYFLGQQEELLVVSSHPAVAVSHAAVDPGGQHASFAGAGTVGEVSLNATTPSAAMITTAKKTALKRLLFFGGQQLSPQPQSWLFPGTHCPVFFRFSSMLNNVIQIFHFLFCPDKKHESHPRFHPGLSCTLSLPLQWSRLHQPDHRILYGACF